MKMGDLPYTALFSAAISCVRLTADTRHHGHTSRCVDFADRHRTRLKTVLNLLEALMKIAKLVTCVGFGLFVALPAFALDTDQPSDSTSMDQPSDNPSATSSETISPSAPSEPASTDSAEQSVDTDAS